MLILDNRYNGEKYVFFSEFPYCVICQCGDLSLVYVQENGFLHFVYFMSPSCINCLVLLYYLLNLIYSVTSVVPSILNEAIPATTRDIENELKESQSLAWQYTALLEKLADPSDKPVLCPISVDMLQQALYNVRQHEAFLKVTLVSRAAVEELVVQQDQI